MLNAIGQFIMRYRLRPGRPEPGEVLVSEVTVLTRSALVGATILVVLLSLSLRATRAERDKLLESGLVLSAGMYVPPLQRDLPSGERMIVASPSSDRTWLIFVYNTACLHSEASLPGWRTLAERVTDDPTVAVVGLSTDFTYSTDEYARTHNLGFETLTVRDPRTRALYRLNAVPQTLVVSPEGQVLYSRLGRLDTTAAMDSVLKALDGHGV